MSEKVIMMTAQRPNAPAIPSPLEAPTGLLADRLARPLHDLRISVTDRCNFRCVYCMPKAVFNNDYQYLPHTALLIKSMHRNTPATALSLKLPPTKSWVLLMCIFCPVTKWWCRR